jgi:hypothetical protein
LRRAAAETRGPALRIMVISNLERGGESMTNANVDLVKSLYDAFGRGDIATIVKASAADIS